jgi:hypothetical protein
MGSLDDGRLVIDHPQAPLWVYPQAPGSNPQKLAGRKRFPAIFLVSAQKSPDENDENEVGEDRKRGQTKTMIRITSAKSIAIFSSAFMPPFRVAEQDSNRDHAED